MALAICTVPVLTGKVADSFEKRDREAERKASAKKMSAEECSAYNKNMEMVKSILTKAKL